MKLRILVVEDEKSISEPLAEGLRREGFDTEVAPTLESARQGWRRSPDLILLDVMLPDGDGRDLAREIRRESDVPIIMLTARGEEIDRVVGLELGADDSVLHARAHRPHPSDPASRAVIRTTHTDPDRRDPARPGVSNGDQG